MNEEEALHMHLNVLETPLENLDIILRDIYKENKTISSSTDNKQSLNNYIAYQKYKIFNSEYINRQIDNEYKNLEEVTIATEKKNEELESQLKSIEQEKVNLIQTKVNMEEQIKTLEVCNNTTNNITNNITNTFIRIQITILQILSKLIMGILKKEVLIRIKDNHHKKRKALMLLLKFQISLISLKKIKMKIKRKQKLLN